MKVGDKYIYENGQVIVVEEIRANVVLWRIINTNTTGLTLISHFKATYKRASGQT